jgi:hypothetical protein
MATDTPVKEEFVAFRSYQVWYRIVGAGEAPGKLPLLCLHGGRAHRTTTCNRSRRWPPAVGA